ncbi:MAG: erythromycin esterase family protein [Gemmatimonadaceae bacterium]|jgi:erythromycin esterase|nr:erythromycin esterase family protein [Gemmatimonadaceae bacterium]
MNRRRFLLRTAGVATAAGASWYGYSRWEQSRAEVDIVAWMREQHRTFDASRPDSITRDGALVAALAGAKVIGIGEATHGSHDDVACKAAIVRALVQAGAIDTLLLEANGPGGRELDAFVTGAFGADSDAAARVREAAIFRILKTEVLAELLAWLRDWNRTATHPVRIVGVDCQASPADAEFALAWLDPIDGATAADFRRRLAPIISAEAQARRFPVLIASLTTAQIRQAMTDLTALQETLSAQGPHAAAPGRDAAERAARTAWQGLHAFELEGSDGVIEGDFGAYYGRRDRSMAENVERAATGRGAVYWAHNNHVAAAPLSDFADSLEPTGYILRQSMGAAYKAVLFEYATARFIAVPRSPFGPIPPSSDPTEIITWGYTGGRLAGLFRALGGGDAWVNLASLPDTPALRDWAQRPYPMRTAGYAGVRWVRLVLPLSLTPREAIDVLVHIENLGPSRMLV